MALQPAAVLSRNTFMTGLLCGLYLEGYRSLVKPDFNHFGQPLYTDHGFKHAFDFIDVSHPEIQTSFYVGLDEIYSRSEDWHEAVAYAVFTGYLEMQPDPNFTIDLTSEVAKSLIAVIPCDEALWREVAKKFAEPLADTLLLLR